MVSESCPACGDVFDRETGEKARNSVIAHMCSKNDDDHLGIGYEKASQMLEYSDISDGVSETVSKDIEDAAETATATDGGPIGPVDPPEPDVATDGGDVVVEDHLDDGVDVPDGFEETAAACDGLEGDYPELVDDDDWRARRRELETEFDYLKIVDGADRDPSIVDGLSEEDL